MTWGFESRLNAQCLSCLQDCALRVGALQQPISLSVGAAHLFPRSISCSCTAALAVVKFRCPDLDT
jgi:hypothetical protein